jgi:hypothetical protein
MKYIIETQRDTYTVEESERLTEVFGLTFHRSEYGDPNRRYLKRNQQVWPVDERTYFEVTTLEQLVEIEKEWGPLLIVDDTITIQHYEEN